MLFRDGVEDTRLKAKAKDTKEIRSQGQGQPFQGQTLSRPRTGMLEAKAKDQGLKRKCSPKKKKNGLHKNFQVISKKKKKKRSSQKFFRRSPEKKPSKKFFTRSTKFQQFKKRGCLRAEDRPIIKDLRPQGQGLDLRDQGQGLQIVSSRTSLRPRKSSRTPPLMLLV